MIDLTAEDHADLLAGQLGDTAHTRDCTNLAPGVYLSDPQGHAQLVGTNHRALTVLDLGGAVHVGGIAVTDPAHLDALADRLHQLAGRLRRNTTH